MKITNSRMSLALAAAALLGGCGPDEAAGSLDEAGVQQAAAIAIVQVDEDLAALQVARDTTISSDPSLVAEALDAARFAWDHDCAVRGVLGGVWRADERVFQGRWWRGRHGSAGRLEGTFDLEDEGAFDGAFDAFDEDGQRGDLDGDIYGADGGRQRFLGTWTSETTDAEGMLAGRWIDVGGGDGLFFGVFSVCDDPAAIDGRSY